MFHETVIGEIVSAEQHPHKLPDKAKKEFDQQVKRITCMYDGDEDQSPRLELAKDGNLIVRVRGDIAGRPTGIGHGSGWTVRDMIKIFPKFKEVYDEYYKP